MIEIKAQKSLTSYCHEQTRPGRRRWNLLPVKIDANGEEGGQKLRHLPMSMVWCQMGFHWMMVAHPFPPGSVGAVALEALPRSGCLSGTPRRTRCPWGKLFHVPDCRGTGTGHRVFLSPEAERCFPCLPCLCLAQISWSWAVGSGD